LRDILLVQNGVIVLHGLLLVVAATVYHVLALFTVTSVTIDRVRIKSVWYTRRAGLRRLAAGSKVD
jgi:hypothetical protein